MFDLLNNRDNTQLWDLLAQNSPMGETGQQMRSRILSTVVQAMETDVSLDTLAENGVIPASLVELVNAQTIRKPARTPEQVEQKLEVLNNSFNVKSGDVLSSADNVLALGGSLNQLSAETKNNGKLVGQVKDKFRRHALEIQRLAEELGADRVVVNQDGTISAPPVLPRPVGFAQGSPRAGIPTTDTARSRKSEELRKYITNYDAAYQRARNLGILEISDAQDMFNPVDATTRATELNDQAEKKVSDEQAETLEVGESDVGILVGQDAVAAVEAAEGPLTPAQRRVVELEGFSTGEYKDTKGIATSGVGQTGEFRGQSFKEVFNTFEEETARMVDDFESFPEAVRAELIQAAYRGDLQQSPKFRRLLNQGKFEEAAREFLDNAEYKNPSTPRGIKRRMEAVAEAVASMEA